MMLTEKTKLHGRENCWQVLTMKSILIYTHYISNTIEVLVFKIVVLLFLLYSRVSN